MLDYRFNNMQSIVVADLMHTCTHAHTIDVRSLDLHYQFPYPYLTIYLRHFLVLIFDMHGVHSHTTGIEASHRAYARLAHLGTLCMKAKKDSAPCHAQFLTYWWLVNVNAHGPSDTPMRVQNRCA